LLSIPFGVKKLAENRLNNHGLPVEYVRQGYLSLSQATKTLHELIMAHQIRHGGQPILRWHASNAVARKDAAGNIKLDKEKSRKKIDDMAALVNAVAGAINHPEDPPSVYEQRGVLWLSAGWHGRRPRQSAGRRSPIGSTQWDRVVCALAFMVAASLDINCGELRT
jgi:Phage Terminase